MSVTQNRIFAPKSPLLPPPPFQEDKKIPGPASISAAKLRYPRSKMSAAFFKHRLCLSFSERLRSPDDRQKNSGHVFNPVWGRRRREKERSGGVRRRKSKNASSPTQKGLVFSSTQTLILRGLWRFHAQNTPSAQIR